MRVTIVSREFPPAVSGIGDHTDHLARELVARGATVTVVCLGDAEERSAFDVAAIARWDRRSITSAVEDSKPDVIVWQYNPFSIGRRGLASSAGRLARALAACAPLVLSLHELWFPWGHGGLRGVAWAIVQRLQGRSALKAASRWIVTTESRERALARLDARKVVRIPIGTNIEPGALDARAVLGIPRDAFVVGHLGSVGPGRDLEPVFDAVATLRDEGIDARVLLAGHTGPLAKPASLNGALMTTGVLAREELSAALACADVYVHADPVGPSAGRRTTLVAALAHGLPVVCYRGPDHAAELIDGRNVVVAEREAGSVAGVLRSLATDARARDELGTNARATFDEHFSWRRIGDAFFDTIRTCL